MPRLEKYKLGGEEYIFANVSEVVGPGGINYSVDVMLVQALLVYLPPAWRGVSDMACPIVTGSLDNATGNAISEYQKAKNREPHNRYRIVPDGRVSPAKGKYVFGRSQYLWTIMSLNNDAGVVAMLRGIGPSGYIENFLYSWTELEMALTMPNN